MVFNTILVSKDGMLNSIEVILTMDWVEKEMMIFPDTHKTIAGLIEYKYPDYWLHSYQEIKEEKINEIRS